MLKKDHSFEAASVSGHQRSPVILGDEYQDYQAPKRFVKPEGKSQNKSSPMYIQGINASDSQCRECGRRVYEMEKIIADQVLYHKSCFKCTYCKRLLSLGTFASMEGVPYCKPHFVEIFKSRGHYDDFGNEDKLVVNQTEEDDVPASKGAPPILPAVKNIKGLFETPGHSSTTVFSPKNPILDSSVQKRPSKWGDVSVEKPVPTPINRVSETGEPCPAADEEEQPPVEITKNLIAKFRMIQKGGGGGAVADEEPGCDRKAVRKMTPPRESPDRFGGSERNKERATTTKPDVVRCVDRAETEEELPPVHVTRNLAEMFRAMVSLDDYSDRSGVGVGLRSNGSSEARRSTIVIDENVEGGVFENEPLSNPDVIRETDPVGDEELPEEGFTRSLVAQWRTVERGSVAAAARQGSEAKSRSPSVVGGLSSKVQPRTNVVATENSRSSWQPTDNSRSSWQPTDNGDEDGIGEGENPYGDGEEEREALPPPDITRNLLAKFKTLEVEGQMSTNQPSAKKQFKWDVKEVKPVNYPRLVTSVDKRSDEENVWRNASEDDDDVDRGFPGDEGGSELPPAQFTKMMLSRFKNMEMS